LATAVSAQADYLVTGDSKLQELGSYRGNDRQPPPVSGDPRRAQAMKHTTTVTSKGPITVPATIRRALGIEKGARIDIYPVQGRFVAQVHRPSRIIEFAGDLAHLVEKPRGPKRAAVQSPVETHRGR
jgi:AbrB family looped-hinge helix DNA binding protein